MRLGSALFLPCPPPPSRGRGWGRGGRAPSPMSDERRRAAADCHGIGSQALAHRGGQTLRHRHRQNGPHLPAPCLLGGAFHSTARAVEASRRRPARYVNCSEGHATDRVSDRASAWAGCGQGSLPSSASSVELYAATVPWQRRATAIPSHIPQRAYCRSRRSVLSSCCGPMEGGSLRARAMLSSRSDVIQHTRY